eukprot:1182666-Prorocentrum_minimum.AAC.1
MGRVLPPPGRGGARSGDPSPLGEGVRPALSRSRGIRAGSSRRSRRHNRICPLPWRPHASPRASSPLSTSGLTNLSLRGPLTDQLRHPGGVPPPPLPPSRETEREREREREAETASLSARARWRTSRQKGRTPSSKRCRRCEQLGTDGHSGIASCRCLPTWGGMSSDARDTTPRGCGGGSTGGVQMGFRRDLEGV